MPRKPLDDLQHGLRVPDRSPARGRRRRRLRLDRRPARPPAQARAAAQHGGASGRARRARRPRHREGAGARARRIPPGAGAAAGARAPGGRDLAAPRLPREPGHRQDDRRAAARRDVPRDGAARRGHLVEVDAPGLVGEYVGQTAIKTDRSCGAPSTACSSSTRPTRCRDRERLDFGAEAIETLLKRMEDHRHRLVVIVAGYPRLMQPLPRLEPGLRSRFSREITFPDYSTDELARDHGEFRENEYRARRRRARDAAAILDGTKRGEGFGNARFARRCSSSAERLRRSGSRRSQATSCPISRRGARDPRSEDFLAAARAIGEEPGDAPNHRSGVG